MVARLLVCERHGQWAQALLRAARRCQVSLLVTEVRSRPECLDSLKVAPASFVCLGLAAEQTTTEQAEAALRWMMEVRAQFPAARVLVFAPRELAALEWAARECGAVDFVTSPRDLSPTVEVIQRHLSQHTLESLDPIEQIWSELPWTTV